VDAHRVGAAMEPPAAVQTAPVGSGPARREPV
jgi:hypothetical protein